MERKYIAQRHDNDCGIAALAMATGLSYEKISADLGECRDCGINDLHIKDWCFRNGWAYQEAWAHQPARPIVGAKAEYVSRSWPVSPFASTHIVLLEATRDYHFVVLDFDGRVRDPWKRERESLAHPDYKRVSVIIGLWKIRNAQEAA